MIGYSGYTHYKPSGIDWLGDVPAHWQVIRIKHLTPVKRGASPRPIDDPKYFDDEGEFAWVRIADVSASDRYLENTTQRLSEIGENLSVKRWPGDLFLSIAGTVGKPIITSIKCCIHDGFVYFPDFKQNNEFLYYIFACGQPYLGLGKMGTQLNLNTDTVGSILIGLPPAEEQEEIVKFLDFKTAQIDALIAKQKTLLDKLSEKRTALISHAVTKGLDPSVPMKNSEVAWLGAVPAHWKVIPIKFSLDMPITDGPHSTPQFYDDGIPFLSAESVKNDRLDFSRMRGYISEDDHAFFSKKYKPKFGDVYMVKSGATTGAVARVETHDEFNIWSPLAVLRPHSEKSVTDYLFYVLKSKPFFYSVELSWSYGTQQNIGMGVISNIRMALPPIEEQQQICRHLEPLLRTIEDQKAKVDSVVERLKEYRSAIITNAVTGKIDVRGFQIPQSVDGMAS